MPRAPAAMTSSWAASRSSPDHAPLDHSPYKTGDTMRRFITALALAASFTSAAHATNFFDGFDGSGGPNGASWQTSNWRNGAPFGCTFAYSEVWLGGNGNLTLNVNSSVPSAVKCAEVRTWQSFTYGKFVVRMQPGT